MPLFLVDHVAGYLGMAVRESRTAVHEGRDPNGPLADRVAAMIKTPKPNTLGVDCVEGVIQLALPDGRPTQEAWLCSACTRVWTDKDSASRCCTCSYCGSFKTWTSGATVHLECQVQKSKEADRVALEKAELVEWDGGPIYFDDKVYDSPEDVLDAFLEGHAPEFIFATEQTNFFFDLDGALENACDQHHDDMRDNLEGIDELQSAVDKFNEQNSGNFSVTEDRSKKIRLVKVQS